MMGFLTIFWLLASLGMAADAAASERIGVLFASYGDIDAPEEAEHYVKSAILDPDIAPLPDFSRGLIAYLGWILLKRQTEDEYRRIGGGTHYRASSRAQADLVAEALRRDGLDARAYTGFIFTYPYIVETLKTVQADGITHLIVFNQGGQYSAVTQGINFREVRKYLNAHPEWKVSVTGVRSFSDDPRFRDLLAQSIEDGLTKAFGAPERESVCILLPSHGLPTNLPDSGDPAIGQMRAAAEDMQNRFPESRVAIGFQNHDEFPGSQWVQPKAEDVAQDFGQDETCEHVLINGRISFTVDNLETLYDEGVEQRNIVLKANPNAHVAVAPMFNSEASFVELMAALTREALLGQGDLAQLR